MYAYAEIVGQDLDEPDLEDVGVDDLDPGARSDSEVPVQFGRRLIGSRVRRRRLEAGMSQRQLAWRCGVTQSTVSRLECGSLTGMRLSTLARLEAALVGRYRDDGLLDPPPAPRRRLPGSRLAGYDAASTS